MSKKTLIRQIIALLEDAEIEELKIIFRFAAKLVTKSRKK